jgi:tRNA-specific 2-thiouridylase
MSKQKHVIVGMSGGVDSSVAALLLQQQGYHVEGLFMKNWEEDDNTEYCTATQDVADAQAVCDRLGITLHTVNFSAEYWEHVFEIFLAEYAAGRTPNPDILCNKEIKFKAFLEHATNLGADFIATGHYVRRQDEAGVLRLLRGIDGNKDQSYFVYTLNQQQLSRSLFPIGDLEKSRVRQLACDAGLITHNKKDSTGICFIGERHFKTFLNNYLPAQKGLIESVTGETLGEHDGLMFYTLGQRKGLGIGGLRESEETPWYVVDKDLSRNCLIVAQGADHPRLYRSTLLCEQLHWIAPTPPSFPLSCTAKIRYRQQDQPCVIEEWQPQKFRVCFTHPQKAITPGQSVVFYQEETCLGGAIIT